MKNKTALIGLITIALIFSIYSSLNTVQALDHPYYYPARTCVTSAWSCTTTPECSHYQNGAAPTCKFGAASDNTCTADVYNRDDSSSYCAVTASACETADWQDFDTNSIPSTGRCCGNDDEDKAAVGTETSNVLGVYWSRQSLCTGNQWIDANSYPGDIIFVDTSQDDYDMLATRTSKSGPYSSTLYDSYWYWCDSAGSDADSHKGTGTKMAEGDTVTYGNHGYLCYLDPSTSYTPKHESIGECKGNSASCNSNGGLSGGNCYSTNNKVTSGGSNNEYICCSDEQWHIDNDKDGYSTACSVYNDLTDCNDADSSVHPGATETCNGVDDNCNGKVDDTDCTSACLNINNGMYDLADGRKTYKTYKTVGATCNTLNTERTLNTWVKIDTENHNIGTITLKKFKTTTGQSSIGVFAKIDNNNNPNWGKFYEYTVDTGENSQDVPINSNVRYLIIGNLGTNDIQIDSIEGLDYNPNTQATLIVNNGDQDNSIILNDVIGGKQTQTKTYSVSIGNDGALNSEGTNTITPSLTANAPQFKVTITAQNTQYYGDKCYLSKVNNKCEGTVIDGKCYDVTSSTKICTVKVTGIDNNRHCNSCPQGYTLNDPNNHCPGDYNSCKNDPNCYCGASGADCPVRCDTAGYTVNPADSTKCIKEKNFTIDTLSIVKDIGIPGRPCSATQYYGSKVCYDYNVNYDLGVLLSSQHYVPINVSENFYTGGLEYAQTDTCGDDEFQSAQGENCLTCPGDAEKELGQNNYDGKKISCTPQINCASQITKICNGKTGGYCDTSKWACGTDGYCAYTDVTGERRKCTYSPTDSMITCQELGDYSCSQSEDVKKANDNIIGTDAKIKLGCNPSCSYQNQETGCGVTYYYENSKINSKTINSKSSKTITPPEVEKKCECSGSYLGEEGKAYCCPASWETQNTTNGVKCCAQGTSIAKNEVNQNLAEYHCCTKDAPLWKDGKCQPEDILTAAGINQQMYDCLTQERTWWDLFCLCDRSADDWTNAITKVQLFNSVRAGKHGGAQRVDAADLALYPYQRMIECNKKLDPDMTLEQMQLLFNALLSSRGENSGAVSTAQQNLVAACLGKQPDGWVGGYNGPTDAYISKCTVKEDLSFLVKASNGCDYNSKTENLCTKGVT